jgi:hypothetical protein
MSRARGIGPKQSSSFFDVTQHAQGRMVRAGRRPRPRATAGCWGLDGPISSLTGPAQRRHVLAAGGKMGASGVMRQNWGNARRQLGRLILIRQ